MSPGIDLRPLLPSVVKVMTVSDAPDYDQPWQTAGPTSGSGSGAIIETPRGLRILTNSHVVENRVFVEVRRYGVARKFVADVEAVGHECDLAVLSVDDDEFFNQVTPLGIGQLPGLSDRVSVCGYPVGGERLSVTEGVVSRIEVAPYAQSQRPLLAVQIDAAINSGNSGGPVFRDGQLIGIAFQSLEEAENISYAIATPIVRHFLVDVENGIYDGFPGLGLTWQRLESAAHRAALSVPADAGGILVTRTVFEGSVWGQIERGDVIVEVDGVAVASDGSVPLQNGELVDFSYVVSRRHVGDAIDLVVLRNGARKTFPITLQSPAYLVPEDRYDVKPTYFVFGGVVFAPLTRDYLKSWGRNWPRTAPSELLHIYHAGIRTAERVDVVLLQKVLADKVNQGYHDLDNVVVTRVNGEPIRGMRDMVARVDAAKTPHVTFEGSDGTVVVIDREEARATEADILERFGVHHDRSADLVASS